MMIDLSVLQDAPITIYATGLFAILMIALSKSGFGGGITALSAPIMLVVLPASEALGVLLPVFILTDIWVVWQRRKIPVGRILIYMILCGLFGQVIGWLTLRFFAVDDRIILIFIGIMAVVTATNFFKSHVISAKNSDHDKPPQAHYHYHLLKRAVLWCSLSGFTSFVSLTGGIAVQIFMLPLRVARDVFVATMAWYFLAINTAKVPFFLELGFITPATITISVLLLPAVPVGVMLGRWLQKIMTDTIFYIIGHILLLLLGCQLLWQVLR